MQDKPVVRSLRRQPSVAPAEGVPQGGDDCGNLFARKTVDHAFPFSPCLDDAFGPQRMFWGSDLTRLKCSYRQCVTLFTEEIPWLTADDLQLIPILLYQRRHGLGDDIFTMRAGG